VQHGTVRATSGKEVALRADTLCIHGDQPGALAFVRRIRGALDAIGVRVAAPVFPSTNRTHSTGGNTHA
jgi:UPF0271 protein